jgi:hypothetical protein
MEHRAPEGVESIVTNPPYKNAEAFVAKALQLVPKVVMDERALLLGAEWHRILDASRQLIPVAQKKEQEIDHDEQAGRRRIGTESCHPSQQRWGPFRTHGLRFIPETWVTLLVRRVVVQGFLRLAYRSRRCGDPLTAC